MSINFTSKMATKKLVQYVAVRKDLSASLSWPTGAVIAQACHACTGVIVLFKDDPYSIEYTQELDRMHKVVVEVFKFFIVFIFVPYPKKICVINEVQKRCEKSN